MDTVLQLNSQYKRLDIYSTRVYSASGLSVGMDVFLIDGFVPVQ